MKVSAIIGVKDEESLIRSCIDHLFAIGVDDLIVQDYGSSDETLEIVKAYRDDRVRLEFFDEHWDLDRHEWGKREADLVRSTKADWVLMLDADEFWLPRNGELKGELERHRDARALTVDRFNLAVDPGQSLTPANLTPKAYDQLMLYTSQPTNFRQRLDGGNPVPWIRGVPMPKMAVRPVSIHAVDVGHHFALDKSGATQEAVRSGDLVIAHVPFTSFERFKLKIDNVRYSLEAQRSYFEGDIGWHWKRWIEIDDRGQLEDEFNRQLVAPEELHALRRAKRVSSVRDFFEPERVAD